MGGKGTDPFLNLKNGGKGAKGIDTTLSVEIRHHPGFWLAAPIFMFKSKVIAMLLMIPSSAKKVGPSQACGRFSSFSLLLSSLEFSDTTMYDPSIRALLRTAPHFCQVVVHKLRTVPLAGCRIDAGDRTTAGARSAPEGQLEHGPPAQPDEPGANKTFPRNASSGFCGMCLVNTEGSYLRLVDFCITQL